MSQDKKSEGYTDWYDLWMKQSREFFASADKNLKTMFSSDNYYNPQDHLKQINHWLNTLKNQWAYMQFPDDQDESAIYWKNMNKMCHEASDHMLEQWLKRAREGHPIKSLRELYDLWLECCHEVFERHLQTKAYQDAYGDLMNATFQFWKTNVPQ